VGLAERVDHGDRRRGIRLGENELRLLVTRDRDRVGEARVLRLFDRDPAVDRAFLVLGDAASG
jgi:hypothetical protein